ncbi:MAG: hypothetical protein PHI05_05105 [Bacilli bacterium]|nr:hypothetical protein [Bacilli bacterium]
MIVRIVFFILQKLIDLIGLLVSLLYSLLPNSPFTIIKNSEFADIISQINYFIPIYEFIAIMETWLIAIAIWYVYSIFARWIKAIE